MHKNPNNYYSFSNTDDHSDDDSSASAAEPGCSPDKEERRTQVTDHDHLEKHPRKGSEKSWLSPCCEVPKSSSPLKFPNLEDEKDEECNRQKKSRRASVRKKPAEKHKSADLLECPPQDTRSDNSELTERAKSPGPFTNKSEKGKQKMKAKSKSFTDIKTNICPNDVNSFSCLSSPAVSGDAAVEPAKETAALQKQKTHKRARASLSTSVRSFSLLGESQSVASVSSEDDNVFEDYFSPANHRHRSKRPLMSDLFEDRDIKVPSELDSIAQKRKQRRSESIASETNSKKKRKLNEKQSGKEDNKQSDPHSHAQQERMKEHLPAVDSPSASVTLVAKRRRQSTLSFTAARPTTSDAGKQRRASTPGQSTVLTEDQAASELQKNSDVRVSHVLESE